MDGKTSKPNEGIHIFFDDDPPDSYTLERLEDLIAALLEGERINATIEDDFTSNTTVSPLSDEYEYPEKVNELRKWRG